MHFQPPPPTEESAQENVNFHIHTVPRTWGSKVISGVEESVMRLREQEVKLTSFNFLEQSAVC